VAWDELELHRWIRRTFDAEGLAGARGDDAAALAGKLARPVLCVDQTVAGVHFERGERGELVGHKACARALSDLAASAARPRAVLAALALERRAKTAWIRSVLRGIDAAARRHGAVLAGGDLSSLPGPRGAAVIAVTAVGERAARGRPVGRGRARPGEVVLLTGAVGGSLLGRHLTFEPRIEAGEWLAQAGAGCLMDTTDGLALDLARIADASGVRIDLERVPVHADAREQARATGRSALDHALHDGEDYELVATLSERAFARASAAEGAPELTAIGRVRRGRGLYVPRCEPSEPEGAVGRLARWREGGWVHGR